jgi:hypothetical protein
MMMEAGSSRCACTGMIRKKGKRRSGRLLGRKSIVGRLGSRVLSRWLCSTVCHYRRRETETSPGNLKIRHFDPHFEVLDRFSFLIQFHMMYKKHLQDKTDDFYVYVYGEWRGRVLSSSMRHGRCCRRNRRCAKVVEK